MRRATRRRALAPLVIGVWWVLAASPTTVWWTLGGIGLAIVATAIVASLLVLHIDWRKRLMHRVRAEHLARKTFDTTD